MRKSLYDISWKVDEPTYRADPAISYSTLATFERGGFASLATLFDRKESSALTFGSMVDTLLTGSREEFDNLFYVADFEDLGKISDVLKSLFNTGEYNSFALQGIPVEAVIPHTEVCTYQLNWKPETRVKVIKEKGAAYWKALTESEGKTVVSTEMYQKAMACYDALKNSEATKWYFEDSTPFDASEDGVPDIERLYQLKFKGEYEGIPMRCMADLVICRHDTKEIIPCDLKTSGHAEYEFPLSFLQWNYMIQAQSYWYQIKQNMLKDPYFKDFKLADYRFIVVNKDSVNPLVWKFPDTTSVTDYEANGKKYRNWRKILKELDSYLKETPKVPAGISMTEPNDINQYFKDHE